MQVTEATPISSSPKNQSLCIKVTFILHFHVVTYRNEVCYKKDTFLKEKKTETNLPCSYYYHAQSCGCMEIHTAVVEEVSLICVAILVLSIAALVYFLFPM